MTRIPTPTALAAALLTVSTTVPAQLTPPPVSLRSQVTPAVLGANRYACQVTNVSSQALTLVRLDLHGSGQVLAAASCAGTASLAPGGSCSVTWTLGASSAWGVPVHCRAQHLGAESALTGSLQAFLLTGSDPRAVASAALQPITGVTLAP